MVLNKKNGMKYVKFSQKDLNKYVISINEAAKKDGGEGAIIIKLRNL